MHHEFDHNMFQKGKCVTTVFHQQLMRGIIVKVFALGYFPFQRLVFIQAFREVNQNCNHFKINLCFYRMIFRDIFLD